MSPDQDEIGVRDLEERGFLHEMATPLGTLLMLIDIIDEDLKKLSELNQETRELSQLMKQGSSAARKLKQLMQERRNQLLERTK